MPTAAEGRILRSLNKHARSNKENIHTPPKSNHKVISTKSPLKKRGPVKNLSTSTKIPQKVKKAGPDGTAESLTRSAGKSQPVPDFSKLHRKWTEKFERGKACKKKPCTQVQEFDITRTGTKFKKAKSFTCKNDVYERLDLQDPSGSEFGSEGRIGFTQSRWTEEELQSEVNSPLQDLTRQGQKNVCRKILGELNCEANTPPRGDGLISSLADIQKKAGIEFNEDSSALQSILDNVGVSVNAQVPSPDKTRHTFAGSSFKTPAKPQRVNRPSEMPHPDHRFSIYTSRTKSVVSEKKCFTDYRNRMTSRLTVHTPSIDAASAVFGQSGDAEPRFSISKPLRIQKLQSSCSSPALRIENVEEKTPIKSPAVRIAGRNAVPKWRDIFVSKHPSITTKKPLDKVAVTLSYGDENVSPSTQKFHSPQTQKDMDKIKELEEIEKQLEMEILRMEKEKSPLSAKDSSVEEKKCSEQPSNIPSKPVSIISPNPILKESPLASTKSEKTPHKHVTFSTDLTRSHTFESTYTDTDQLDGSPTRPKRQISPNSTSCMPAEKKARSCDELNHTLDELNQSLGESMAQYNDMETEMKTTKSRRRSVQILVQLEELKRQQQEMLKLQAELQRQLAQQQRIIDCQQRELNKRSSPKQKDQHQLNLGDNERQSQQLEVKESQEQIQQVTVNKEINKQIQQVAGTDSLKSSDSLSKGTVLYAFSEADDIAHSNQSNDSRTTGSVTSVDFAASVREASVSGLFSATTRAFNTYVNSTINSQTTTDGGIALKSSVSSLPSILTPQRDIWGQNILLTPKPVLPHTSGRSFLSPAKAELDPPIKTSLLMQCMSVKRSPYIHSPVSPKCKNNADFLPSSLLDSPTGHTSLCNSPAQSGKCRSISKGLDRLCLLENGDCGVSLDLTKLPAGRQENMPTTLRPQSLMSRIAATPVQGSTIISTDRTLVSLNHTGLRSERQTLADTTESMTNNRKPDNNEDSVGSLSLVRNLQTSRTTSRCTKLKFGQSVVMKTALQFHDLLLDEECALYACRLPIKISPCKTAYRCANPVARTLEEGDDMHFIPIKELCSNATRFLADSAFCSYSPYC